MSLHSRRDKRISSRLTRIVFIVVLMGVMPLLATDRLDCYWDYTFTHYHRNPDWDPSKPEYAGRDAFLTNSGDRQQFSVNGTFKQPYANDRNGYLPVGKEFEKFFGRPLFVRRDYPLVARLLKPEHSLQNHPERRLAEIMWCAPTQRTLHMLGARGHRVLTLETDLGFYAITIIQVPLGESKTSLSKSDGQKLLDAALSKFDGFNCLYHVFKELIKAEAHTGNDSSVYLSTVVPNERVVPSYLIWMPTWPSDTLVDPESLVLPPNPRLRRASSIPAELGAEETIQQQSRKKEYKPTTAGYLLILLFVLGIPAVAITVVSCVRKDPESVKMLCHLEQSLGEAPHAAWVRTVSDGSSSCCEESV